ncbi:MAG: hypothetical protein Q9P14_04545 [candidate division KSB1 bacterium]|nr:hypothetical protein [candidate division KSB1 bacterium]MDQ7065243.1 hypothetical protein [candidate division KSB1 bacterium]
MSEGNNSLSIKRYAVSNSTDIVTPLLVCPVLCVSHALLKEPVSNQCQCFIGLKLAFFNRLIETPANDSAMGFPAFSGDRVKGRALFPLSVPCSEIPVFRQSALPIDEKPEMVNDLSKCANRPEERRLQDEDWRIPGRANPVMDDCF